VTRIKHNPFLGWEIFKIESKQIRDVCFLKFGNTVKPISRFYGVAKLKKTIIFHLLTLDFKNFPT
jgi:hypothetical protein